MNLKYFILVFFVFLLIPVTTASDQQTLTLRPNADGTYTEFACTHSGFPNYQSVYEAVPDDGARFVYNPSTLAKDTYNITDHTTETHPIASVTVYNRAWHDKTTSRVRPVIYTNSSLYYGDWNYLSTTWTTFSHTWTTNPNTSSLWTWDEIDNMEIGGQLSTGIPTNARITQVYAEVVYGTPDPTNLQNTSGNFWINYTWDKSSSEIDSYNVSQNNTWVNGTTNNWNNSSVSAHGYSNIIVYGYNATTGLSNFVSDNFTVPNNVPIANNLMTEHVTNNSNVYTNTSTPYFNWTYSDTDSDTQYSWEIQVGTSSGINDKWNSGQLLGTDSNDIYAGSALARNTTYYVQVRTNDGYENGSWTTGTFKINTLPVVNNITITPGAPLDTDDLVVGNDTATDGDGDPTVVYYHWYKDDVLQTALNDIITINSSNTTDGEVWKVGVIPNDTYENGTEVFSATVTIGSGNYAPTITGITTNVSTKKYGYSVLVSTINAFDQNDDNYILHVGNSTGASNLCNSSSTPNGTGANCSFVVPWTSGIHTLYGRLTDQNDTSVEKNIVFTVDVTPPVYVSSGVSPSSLGSDETTNITALITLPNGTMDYVKVKVMDINYVSTNYTMSDINGTWTYVFSPTGAGTYSVSTIYAADDSGNVMSPQSVSHSFIVTDVTGGAGGAGGAAPNITVVGDLTLTPDRIDTYFWYTAVSGDRKGVWKFVANRNLETCRVEPNTHATCEIVDGYIVLVTLTVNETVKTYDGTLTVTDDLDYTASSTLVVRVIKPWDSLPIPKVNVGPFVDLLTIFFETSETTLIGIRIWFVGGISGLFVLGVYKSFRR